MFTKLGVKLLYSIAYHPQTDGFSERTNQTVEIALRFFIHALKDPAKWPKVLPQIQSILNNTSSSTTGKIPNEVAYDFTPRRLLDLLSAFPLPQPLATRAEASDTISFAMSNQKTTYDRKYQPLFMKVGDWALLWRHKGYSIPATTGVTKKLMQQYVGPFLIKERVGRLTYKLDIPLDWRIYLVFSITQWEPAPTPFEDPFLRPQPTQRPSVYVDGETDTYKSFEVERLLNKRTVKRGRGRSLEYPVRWKGYGPEWDRWYNVKAPDNAAALVEDYEASLAATRSHFNNAGADFSF